MIQQVKLWFVRAHARSDARRDLAFHRQVIDVAEKIGPVSIPLEETEGNPHAANLDLTIEGAFIDGQVITLSQLERRYPDNPDLTRVLQKMLVDHEYKTAYQAEFIRLQILKGQ